MPLSHRKIQTLKAPGKYADGGNLYLQITATGSKSWAFRYSRAGRARQMGFGPADLVSLAEARELARDARRELLAGIDPIAAKRASRAQNAAATTFQDAALAYIAAHEGGWKNDKHRTQWTSSLENYAFPVIGALALDAIDTPHVLAVIEPIWKSKTETASRVRGRIERVLDWATTRGQRSGENPARWRGHLQHLLPARNQVQRVRNQPGIPWRDMPSFMTELRSRDSISARALEFCILTAARTGEVIGAPSSEFDMEHAVWSIPAERMKARVAHRVPLSPESVAIIHSVPRLIGSDRVFQLSNMAMLEMLRGIQPGFTVHGFRSSFKTWAMEHTGHSHEIIEGCLAHVIKNKAEAAYVRGDALAKRRTLLCDGCDYLIP